MKVMKAMKKLKFWSTKKKKIKTKFMFPNQSPPPPLRPAPPPPPPDQSHEYEPLLPSAPPLPPWLEHDLQFQEMPSKSQPDFHFPPPNDHELQHYVACSNDIISEDHKVKKSERGVGAVGCVVSFGDHLLRCVFPCFHIREDTYKFE